MNTNKNEKNETLSIKITGLEYPEILCYEGNFREVMTYIGTTERMAELLYKKFIYKAKKMRENKQKYLKITFDVCEGFDNESGTALDERMQMKLFD